MLKIDYKLAKTMFFDRAKVKRKVDAGTRRVLSKFGAYVRKTSRDSIRKRKAASKPGLPPSSHTGILKRFLYFGYDGERRSVVIGPVIAPSKSGETPPTLEYGGKITLEYGNRVNIAPRPFMQPAFDKELPGVNKLWRDSIIN